MSSGHWDKRDWDKIAADLSSGEDSDAYDGPNVVAVQRNAHRVAELLHATVPGLDPDKSGAPAMGTNDLNALRAELLASAMRGASPRARASPARPAAPPPAEGAPPPPAAEGAPAAAPAAEGAPAAAPAAEGAPAAEAPGVLV